MLLGLLKDLDHAAGHATLQYQVSLLAGRIYTPSRLEEEEEEGTCVPARGYWLLYKH